MAVYTKLTFEEIAGFLGGYEIGELVSYKEIIDGIDNSNFIITTDQGQFILTIFEKRIDPRDLPFFMNLKLHLARKGINCPKPIANKNGSLISSINEKPASIVTFLSGATLKPEQDGYYRNIAADHCYQAGQNLALLHNAVMDFEGARINDLGILGWRKLLAKMPKKVEKYQAGLKAEIENYINFLENNWRPELSGGVVHLDAFPDNVFFKDEQLSGIIDFYFSASDLFIYDLAIVINAWCFDENNQMSPDKFAAVINGYKEVRLISVEEMEFLKIALIGAALRFLLSRLYDLFNTKKGSLVNIKNPDEYLQKIRFFANGVVN